MTRRETPVTGCRTLLVGVGNLFRGDDGIGPAVVEAVRRQSPAAGGVTAVVCDPTQLLDVWADMARVVIIDAIRCEPSNPGRIHRLTGGEIPKSVPGASTTHGFGILQALTLSQELGRGPEQILVIAVEGADFQLGNDLSPEVAKSIPEVINLVAAELS